MESAAWNTNRKYGKEGQRIAALQLAGGEVAFTDIDRGISGITIDKYEYGSFINFVLSEYDAGRYNEGFHAVPYAWQENLRNSLSNMIANIGGGK